MSRTCRQDAAPLPKPRQRKQQKRQELLAGDKPQPEVRPEPVHYKPLG